MELPRLITLNSKSNSKYLRYVNENGKLHGYVQSSGDAIISPYTKFEVERAQIGSRQSGSVHLRCSYNNKYLVRESETGNFIVAASDEPEEDRSKWSCTLFEPIYVSDPKVYRFRHVQLGFFVSIQGNESTLKNCIAATSPIPEIHVFDDLFTIVDWQTLCILPRYVTFRQGSFLKAYLYKDSKYLQFGESDDRSGLIGHEVFTLNDGTIRIKSLFWNFWRRDPNWILADSNDTTADNPNTIFRPAKVAGTDNIITLTSLGNGRFCKRLTVDGKESCLNAGVDSVTAETKMEVKEYVISREIYNVQFQTKDARIYNAKPMTMISKDSVNNTNESTTTSVGFTYENSKSSTWQSTVGLTLGVSVSMETGVPFIAEGTVEISTELSTEHSWGKEEVETKTMTTNVEVEVPPHSERRVSVVATKGQCDVPFSYTQKDYLANGKVVIIEKFDGLYSGLEYYEIREVVDDPRPLSL